MTSAQLIIVLCAATAGVFSSPTADFKVVPKSVLPVPKPIPSAHKLVPAVPTSVPIVQKPISSVATSRRECRAANEEFDRALELANQDFLLRGNTSVPVAGFQQNVYLSYSGASLFVKFRVETSGGSLRLNTASRTGNAIICNEPAGQTEETLHGALQFAELNLQFGKFHAEYFKSSSLDGKLSYRVRPVVDVVLVRSPDRCRLDVINFVDTTSDEYQVTADSWKDWIVAQLVGRSLKDGGDSTPILQNILESLKQSFEDHFVKTWCNSRFA